MTATSITPLLVNANSLRIPLPDKSVHCVPTSPPYLWQRDYQVDGQLGLEKLHDCQAWASGYANVDALVAAALDIAEQCQVDAEARLTQIVAFLREMPGAIRERSAPCGRCFVCNMRQFAAEVWRILRDDGVFWLNLGDSYAGGGRGGNTTKITGKGKNASMISRPVAGITPKQLISVPWRVALALQADGWILRSDVVWSKPNPMPESVTDRPAKSHEYVFLLTKSKHYFYDAEAVKEPVSGNAHPRGKGNRPSVHPKAASAKRGEVRANGDFMKRLVMLPDEDGRNRRTVWTIASTPYAGTHFATWPPELVEVMIRAGTSEAGCCPECGTPWKRIIVKSDPRPRPDNPNPVLPYTADSNHRQGIDGSTLHMTRQTTTLGWEPGCDCQIVYPCEQCRDGGDCLVCDGKGRIAAALTPIPCTVLDPFVGSGTTLMVARQLGRRSVGLDLSFDYLKNQARPRLGLDKLDAFENGHGVVVPDVDMDTLPLFAGVSL